MPPARGAIIVPTVILAELDYLLREFLGVDAKLDFLKGIASGAYTLESFMTADGHSVIIGENYVVGSRAGAATQ